MRCFSLIQTDQIIHGNTLSVLNTLPSESIDCVITSPPYWGLRDYGIEGQLGLEPTFVEYIQHMQEIFNELYRVLKKTGTCWVNIGDTYSNANNDTAPTKSLCNIPFRFAISMTDHGWIQRNTIIWHKPSCMPSSAKDRFTVDFEYVFLFSKNKKYYFEQQFEAYADITLTETKYNGQATKDYESAMAQNPSDTKRRVINSIDTNRGRNKRTVWRINPQPFREAHFAVFPEKLVEPMVKAGCPGAICESCGEAYEHNYNFKYPEYTEDCSNHKYGKGDDDKIKRGNSLLQHTESTHHNFTRDINSEVKKCDCDAPTHAGIVLDPFVGSGTTALVARKLQRHYIGIDLNADYVTMANKRLSEVL